MKALTGSSPWLWQTLLLGLILWANGCATTRIDWQSRVGNYTYDQAVRELGPSDKLATLQDGTRVAEWLLQRGYYTGMVQRNPGFWVQQYDMIPTPDYYLRLTFAPDGKLTAWKHFSK